jgi:Antitoxin Xre/MbcA/ParS C-terminal toxin-binding domain
MDKRPRKTHRPSSRQDVVAGPALLSPERFEPKARERLGAPALRTFAAITGGWGLSEAQRLSVLGFPGRSTYHYWLAKARDRKQVLLPVDTLLRLSAVLGIHKDLRILFGRAEDEGAWLKKPHDAPVFGGQPPINLVTNGTQDGLMLVRRYLDAWRGGVFAAPNAADRNFAPYSDEDIVIV